MARVCTILSDAWTLEPSARSEQPKDAGPSPPEAYVVGTLRMGEGRGRRDATLIDDGTSYFPVRK
jgi:hypothetical protein